MQSNVFNAKKCKTNKYVYLDINGVKKSLEVLGRKLIEPFFYQAT